MGCGMSKDSATPAKGSEPDTAVVRAKTQRRKLSVAPQHEGGGGVDENNNIQQVSTFEAEVTGTMEPVQQEQKGLVVIEVVSKSQKGFVPYSKKKINQDRPLVKFSLQGDSELHAFGVMDGHGENGHFVAQFVMERLPIFLEQQENLKNDVSAGMIAGTAELVQSLADTQHTTITAFSGTTCVFSVLNERKLYVGNIGDSRCVMLRQNTNGIEALDLSIDQKPEDEIEMKRIIAAGGRVEPLPGPPDEDCGPHRVWLADMDVPGLAMSRSIGDDVARSVGVISIPEITSHDIQDNDILAIWASDGIWEFMSSEEVVTILWMYKDDLPKGVDALIEESTKRWRAEEEVIDDITAVVVKFNEPR